MRKPLLNDYFGFNKQQRRGAIFLCSLCCVIAAIRFTYPYFLAPSHLQVQWINFPTDSSTKATLISEQPVNTSASSLPASTLTFNPNTASLEILVAAGFPKKTASTLLKFRAKGFALHKKEDLLKVYGITQTLYAQLAPRMQLPAQETTPSFTTSTAGKPVSKIELNTADSTALQALPGIGPALTKRILKYRNLLGGFYSTQQLTEVYGISAELYQSISSRLSVDTLAITPLYPNLSDFKSLNKHPYIGYELSKKICNQREKERLNPATMQVLLNNSAMYLRLRPYLAFAK